MEEAGNKYHDDKGHFTDKANDGKECKHSGLQISENPNKGWFVDDNGYKHDIVIKETKTGKPYYEINLYDRTIQLNDLNILNKKASEYSAEIIAERDKEKNINRYFNELEDDFSYLKEINPKHLSFLKKKWEEEKKGCLAGRCSRATDFSKSNIYEKEFNGKKINVIDYYWRNGYETYPVDKWGERQSFNLNNKEKIDSYFNELNEEEKKIEENKKRIEEEKRIRNDLLKNPHSFRDKVLSNKISEKELNSLSDFELTSGTYVGGYSGYSRSRSAEESEEQGSKPMSHWKKEDILDYLTSSEDLRPFEQDFRKMKTDKLKDLVLYNDGWHHTSKYFNRTPFYGIKSPRDIIKGLAYEHNAFERGLKKGFEEK